MSESFKPIVVEQTFSESRATIWAAITEHHQMVQWFFSDIPEFKSEPGFQTQFNVNAGERDFNHLWKITEVEPDRKIVYDWRYEGYAGAGVVTFEMFDEENDGSRLRVTAEGIESFPQDIPEFSRESGEAGWKYFIQSSLKDYLESEATK